MTTAFYSKDRAINEKVRELERRGWRVWRGAKHYRAQHPNGFTITVPGTPSCSRAVNNWFAQIQRAERNEFRPLPTNATGGPR